MAIEQILDLEQLEVNIYRGSVFSPESGFLQRTFGGHVAGQSLVSAVRTVDPQYLVHSLHGYFLRPGDAKAPTVFLVERLRDGGSFCTRRVSAIQHGETIFSMSASFQTDQEGINHQDVMPAAPPPDGLPGLSSIKVFDDAGFKQFEEWDVCIVPRERLHSSARQGLPAAGVVPPSRPVARRSGVAHLRAGLYERPHAAGIGTGQSPRRASASAGGVAGPRDVVHAAVPGRRVVALRPVLAVGLRWSRAAPRARSSTSSARWSRRSCRRG